MHAWRTHACMVATRSMHGQHQQERSAVQSWLTGSKRPEIGNHHAAEVINNKLYLFGGLSKGSGTVQIGTLTTSGGKVDISWKKGANLPASSGSAATAYIKGKVC
jgi:hypothetical protein